MFRAREAWLWTFIMPVIFFYFIGTITGGFAPSTTARESIGVLTPPDAGFLGDHLVARLGRHYDVVRVTDAAELARHRRRLVIPAGFTAQVLAAKPVKIAFTRTGGGLGAEYDQIRLQRAVYSVLADLVATATEGGAPTAQDLAAIDRKPRALTLEVTAAGRRQRIPTGFEQAVPGTMVMFTLLVLFTSGAVTLAIERNQGILRRMASSAISRGSMVLGKWMGRLALGLVQIAFAMITGSLLFGVHWGPSLPAVLVVLTVYAALAAALGMLLGNFLATEKQVIGIGVLATNAMAALGGCWWPIEITPRWVQGMALLFPTGWAMDAMHKLVSFGLGPAAVAPHLAVMTAAALVAGWLVARWFRFQ